MTETWTKTENPEIKTYVVNSQDEVIYIIRGGGRDCYIVVYDDAYEISRGETFLGTKEQVETKFNIKL